jgi:hypothetical protein
MAYLDPNTIHADDWNAPIIVNSGAASEAKLSHSNAPLTTNPLTHAFYTTLARRWTFTDGNVRSQLYLLNTLAPTNAPFVNDSAAVAGSLVSRKEVRNNNGGPVVVLRYSAANSWYGLGFDYWTERLVLNGNRDTDGAFIPGESNYALYKNLSFPLGTWHGIRLVATTEGLDVRLRCYTADLTALNGSPAYANGEPNWVEQMSCRHQDGNNTPQDVVGASATSGFGSTAPALSGTPGFAVGAKYWTSNNIYVDAVRFKRIP